MWLGKETKAHDSAMVIDIGRQPALLLGSNHARRVDADHHCLWAGAAGLTWFVDNFPSIDEWRGHGDEAAGSSFLFCEADAGHTRKRRTKTGVATS